MSTLETVVSGACLFLASSLSIFAIATVWRGYRQSRALLREYRHQDQALALFKERRGRRALPKWTANPVDCDDEFGDIATVLSDDPDFCDDIYRVFREEPSS